MQLKYPLSKKETISSAVETMAIIQTMHTCNIKTQKQLGRAYRTKWDGNWVGIVEMRPFGNQYSIPSAHNQKQLVGKIMSATTTTPRM